MVKSTTIQSVKYNILLESLVSFFCADKFEGICNSLFFPDNSVYDIARQLKSDVSENGAGVRGYSEHDTTHFIIWATSC